jgi:hypothetical protein
MNWIELFENFNREQPLEKDDVINLLEGSAVNYSSISEFPIRDVELREFYLGWTIVCFNPRDWVYNPPRNYKVNFKYHTLEFIWQIKPSTDFLLYKITPNWKEVKKFIIEIIDLSKRIDLNNGFLYVKMGRTILEWDKTGNFFGFNELSIYNEMGSRFKMDYNEIKTFLWILFEDMEKIKVKKVLFF